MQADALKFVAEQARAADPSKRIVAAPAEPPHVYYVLEADGNLKREYAASRPGRHVAADLQTLAEWVKLQKDTECKPEVWYSRSGVVAGLDPADEQFTRCTLPLSPSPQMAALQEWEHKGRAHFPQDELVRTLRTTFYGCYPAHPKLVDVFRNVKVAKAENANANVGHGKVSLDRSMVAEMTGLQLVPEQITFRVPVFANASLAVSASVLVDCEPDPKAERFILTVIAGQLEAAYTLAEDWLARQLSELLGDAANIYHGRPTGG